MNKNPSLQASLCIDLKKNRIRIHRHTLQLLGNPDYIQLLVNPDSRKIAIKNSTAKDHLAHKICLNTSDCIELYSSYLIENLKTVTTDFEPNCSYRLYGNVNPQAGIAFFSMIAPTLITDD